MLYFMLMNCKACIENFKTEMSFYKFVLYLQLTFFK